MILVGLTGGVGTGKTTVAKRFRELNVPVIDADLIARQIVEPDKPAWRKLKQTFGDDYFFESGELNRKKLGELVFGDINRRRQLNAITHGYIRWEIMKLILFYFLSGKRFVVLDLPLLFESGWNKILQYIIVVTCDGDGQLKRVIARDQIVEMHAKQRINAQFPLPDKVKRANFVIDNAGTVEETFRQTDVVYNELSKSRLYLVPRVVFLSVFSVLPMILAVIFIKCKS